MRVGISRLRGEVFFPNIWKYFHASHPNITIDLIDGNSEENEELLLSGKLDLFIGVDIPPQPNLCLVELAREKVQCCLSRTLLQQYYPDNWEVTLENFKQGIDLSQIMELPFITVRQKNRLRKDTRNGQAIAVSLDRNAFLHDGDVLLWDEKMKQAVICKIDLCDVLVIDLSGLQKLTPPSSSSNAASSSGMPSATSTGPPSYRTASYTFPWR